MVKNGFCKSSYALVIINTSVLLLNHSTTIPTVISLDYIVVPLVCSVL